MKTAESRRPVRWLFLSATALDSVSNFWRSELGADSVLACRLNSGLINATTLATLADSLANFPRDKVKTVVLIFDNVDADTYAAVDALSATAVQGLELRVAGFRDDPLEIVTALNSSVLVDENDIDVEEPADEWESMPIHLLRAASITDDETESHIEARPDGPAHEDIVLSRSRHPLDGTETLMIEIDPSARDRYIGREVRVMIGAMTYTLGKIQLDGIACQVVPGPVELADDKATLLLRVSHAEA